MYSHNGAELALKCQLMAKKISNQSEQLKRISNPSKLQVEAIHNLRFKSKTGLVWAGHVSYSNVPGKYTYLAMNDEPVKPKSSNVCNN